MFYRHPNNRATAVSTGIRPARRRRRIRPPALTPPTIPMARTRRKDSRPRSRADLPRELPRICGSGFKRWIPTGKSGWISGKSAVTSFLEFFLEFFPWKKFDSRSGKINALELKAALLNGNYSTFTEGTCRLMYVDFFGYFFTKRQKLTHTIHSGTVRYTWLIDCHPLTVWCSSVKSRLIVWLV